MYTNGRGVEKDESRAAPIYQKGCDLGDTASCVSLAGMYLNGSGVAKDESRAAQLAQKACDLGDAQMCGDVKTGGQAPPLR